MLPVIIPVIFVNRFIVKFLLGVLVRYMSSTTIVGQIVSAERANSSRIASNGQ